MLANHARPSLFLLILYLGIGCLSLAYGRVLIRPSVSTLIPYNTGPTIDRYARELLYRSEQPDTANVTSSDHIYNDLSSFLTTKRLQRRGRAIKQPAPASDTVLSDSAAKGCNMLYMLAADEDDALTRLKTNPSLADLEDSQSGWDNAGALKKYGWTEKKGPVNWGYMGISDVLKELEIAQTQENVNVQLLQDTPVTVDGKSYVASKGTYDQAINVAEGIIMPYYVFSPRNEAKEKNIQGEIVPLERYSDVLFLEYSKLCGRAHAQVSDFRYFLALNIQNVNTWSIALKALVNKNGGNKEIQYWPGTEFSLNEPEGKALLGTQIGAPLAWMLIQHKHAFGTKSVVKVRIFRNKSMTNRDTESPFPSLLFYVGDAPPDNEFNHCEPEDSCCCPKF